MMMMMMMGVREMGTRGECKLRKLSLYYRLLKAVYITGNAYSDHPSYLPP